MCNRRCLFVCSKLCAKTYERICIKLLGKIGIWQWASEQMGKFWWRSGSPYIWIHGLFSGFVTIGRYGKWYQSIALRDAAGIAIATMTSLCHRRTPDSGTDIATMVRRTLAEVCTVPVLLVFRVFRGTEAARCEGPRRG